MSLISVARIADLFIMAIVNFSTVRKNMRVQNEQQEKKFENTE